ncbi:hypothetical protein COJ96_05945 [Bacillus sp. AFS073361]|uniref:SU10 major capsid protein n=1 Tax=Bacillus sp. AFS073361 TaxID=2033511 RepID=UPI000BF81203|nr:DUF5309 family protein [Bacillus sp. AFS073361]PFP30252.1 hypothetical protein COJ96_05945 [Bacillus sp. AFS073361]
MPVNTYSFQNQVRQLQEGISMIINDEPTLLGLIGLSGEPLFQTKFEWMSDNLNSNRANLAANLDAVATTFNVASGDGSKFRVNALLVLDDEYMKVTAVAGDAITVVRGFDGTTAATHTAASSEIRIVARPQLEGAGVGQDESHDRYVDYNVTQIFERYASVSNTQQAVRTYNVSDELNYQVQLRLKELAREFNDALIYGRRIDAGGSQPRMTGGLLNFANLKSSVKQNLAGGEVTAKVVNDALEQVYQRGGNVNTILTNTAGARQFSKLLGDKIQIQRQDTTRGGYVATFVSDIVGGDMATIVVDKNMPKDKVVLFDRSILSMHALNGRSLYDVDATVAGADFVARQIRGEYGVKVMNAKEKIAVLENVSKTVS